MYYRAEKMNDNVLFSILSGIGGVLLLLFGITSKKVDKADYDKHCERQAIVNDKLEKTLQELGQYELTIIPNINIYWWRFFYKMQYGVYPVLFYFSRILFQPTFALLNRFVHKGETFREIYVIKAKKP